MDANKDGLEVYVSKFQIPKVGFGFFVMVFLVTFGSFAAYDHLFRSTDSDHVVAKETMATGTLAADLNFPTTSTCNIAGIKLRGDMVTYIPAVSDAGSSMDVSSSEKIVEAINNAEADSRIKAIIVEIDSRGGDPVAGDEVSKALKSATKPTVAVIRSQADSAAYFAASGASHIIASLYSDVGSIGVTQSYAQNSSKDRQFIQISAGKFKDAGNPDKPITEEERQVMQKEINIMYKNFVQAVATNRKIPIKDVTKIADGSSYVGGHAKELKLIDEIGGLPEATAYLQTLFDEKATLCSE